MSKPQTVQQQGDSSIIEQLRQVELAHRESQRQSYQRMMKHLENFK